MTISLFLLVALALGGFAVQRWVRVRATAASPSLQVRPDGVLVIDGDPLMQMIEREGIPTIDLPEFVPIGKAKLDDSALVMTATLNGETHVYSIEFMNQHELVNDKIGGVPVAVTY